MKIWEFQTSKYQFEGESIVMPKGEFSSNHNEIYNSPPILFETTESFTESYKTKFVYWLEQNSPLTFSKIYHAFCCLEMEKSWSL